MKDYKLSEIKQICENINNNEHDCSSCPLSKENSSGRSLCELMFDTVAPKDWIIVFDKTDKGEQL